MTYREAWVRFAAAVLDGTNAVCNKHGNPKFDSDQCVEIAAEQADRMLVELRKRFDDRGQQAAGP